MVPQPPPPPPSSDDCRIAGNLAFKNKDYEQALMFYTLAINNYAADGSSPPPSSSQQTTPLYMHYSNRSLVHSIMESYDLAISDAKECIRLSGGECAKGYFRVVKAMVAKSLYNEAIEMLDEGIHARRIKCGDGGDGSVEDRGNGREVQAENDKNENDELSSMIKLRENVRKRKKIHDKKISSGSLPTFEVKSIITDGRKPSVKEFDVAKELGTGNFSRILSVTHKKTKETFALKVIEKKQVESLKRRHPNIHNEIQMEKRVLVKLRHPLIVTLYQTFQDYSALYFLMELCSGAEMWTKICHGSSLCGCHESLAQFYLSELVAGIEYMHSCGIVHRDLKPENLMVSESGHLKIIDFGTAKDLKDTDLNGPEFVGTPEFMSPEAVKSKPTSYEADLWGIGVVMYQMLLGTTPFKAPSPYLGFLKIKRGIIYRHPALEDDAWDLIQGLLKIEADKRIGAGR